MNTRFRFERSAMVSAVTITNDDGGSCFVFCSVPGGRPQFQIDRNSQWVTSVSEAPPINNHKDFERFVRERFGEAQR